MQLFKGRIVWGRRCAVWVCAATTVLKPSSSVADEGMSRSAERAVTLAEVERRIDSLPAVQAGRLRIEGAKAAVGAAGAASNPVFEAQAGYAKATDDTRNGVEWGVGVTVPFGWLNGREARSGAARAALSSEVAAAGEARLEATTSARILFFTLVYEQARTETLRALYDKSLALQTMAVRRVEKGEARPVEASRATVETLKVEDELWTAEAERALRSAQLCVWMGMAADCNFKADARLEEMPVFPETGVLGIDGKSMHPSLSSVQATVEARAADLQQVKRARAPDISVSAYLEQELDRRGEGGEISIELPLFNRQKDGIRSADAHLKASRIALEDRKTAFKLDAMEATAACQSHLASAKRYRDEILPPAAAAALLVEKSYALGEVSMMEVIDAERTLLDMKLRYLSQLFAAHTACSRTLVFTSKGGR